MVEIELFLFYKSDQTNRHYCHKGSGSNVGGGRTGVAMVVFMEEVMGL
jgi:hypothetical protein